MKKGLGKGFDALMPSDFDKSILAEAGDRIQNLLIDDVVPNPEQPRKSMDTNSLDELAASIKRYGILQPLIVSPRGTEFVIVAGERRWRAARLAGKDKVPAIVRERKDLEQLEIALIENVQRVDLTPLEQAISIEKLHHQFNMSYQAIAERLGKAQSTVHNIARLLNLAPNARDALAGGSITEGHARAILALKGDNEKQAELLRLIIARGWTVRQAEQFVNSVKEGSEAKKAAKATSAETLATKSLSKRMNTKVTLKRMARGGRLEIHYKDDDELDGLLVRLNKI